MSGLKWRLFSSSKTSSSKGGLKKLWTDYLQVLSNSDNEIENPKSKTMVAFLDGILIGTSFSLTQHHNHYDELTEDLPTIFKTILQIIKNCLEKSSLSSFSTHSTGLGTGLSEDLHHQYMDLATKSLFSLEILTGCTQHFKPSSSIVEKIYLISRTHICNILDLLDMMTSSSHISQILRILKMVTSSIVNLNECLQHGAYLRLAKVAQHISEPQIVTQVTSLLRFYYEKKREEKIPFSSVQHSNGDNIRSNIFHQVQQLPLKSNVLNHYSEMNAGCLDNNKVSTSLIDGDDISVNTDLRYSLAREITTAQKTEDESLAAKGFNFAFQFMGDLLKMTSLSSSWLGTQEYRGRSNSMISDRALDVDRVILDINSFLECIVHNEYAWVDERIRVMDLISTNDGIEQLLLTATSNNNETSKDNSDSSGLPFTADSASPMISLPIGHHEISADDNLKESDDSISLSIGTGDGPKK